MRGMYRQTPLAVLVVSLVLTGCSLAPTYHRPAPPVPDDWKLQDRAAATGGASAHAYAALDWQLFVRDAVLRQLINTALQNSRKLRQTLLDVQAARAEFGIQQAERLPRMDGQLGGTRGRTSGDTGSAGLPGIGSAWQAGVGITAFELDLFGRVRNLSEAALEEYLAGEAAARAVQISLIAELIQVYVIRDGALQRQRLTARTLQSRELSQQLISRRLQYGTATALDYQEAVGLTEQARAELEQIDRELRQASNALDLLVGAANPALPDAPSAGPLLLHDFAAGAPSELLSRRPDIQAAEHRLRARNASIGAARAAFFPRISLTGFLGSSSTALSDLFSSGRRSWSFTPQVTMPIFDGGRSAANLDLARVRKDSAVAAYEEAVQVAFREVSDALTAVDTLRKEEAARRELADSSQRALRLSELRWRAGVDDHLRYLDAQRNAFANQLASIHTNTQQQIALSTLFKTLGGGAP